MPTIVDPTTFPPDAPIHLSLHLAATLNLSADDARHAVNCRILPDLGIGMTTCTPELVIVGETIIWRVPLALSLPELGNLGQVGTVDVDARTGEVLLEPEHQRRILQHAQRLYAGATLPPE
jgi:hypothetical protein